MDFREKIKKLTDGGSIKRLAKAADLPYGTLLTYVNSKNRTPSVFNAIQISRALGVEIEWLFDNGRDWPPPPPPNLSAVPPIEIAPFPPHGLTWLELQEAIADFVQKRAARQLAALEAGKEGGPTQ